MKGRTRVLVVLSGYVLAFIVAAAAVFLRQLLTRDPIAEASSGMYAFGDMIVFGFVFGALAIPPTVMALYFARTSRALWSVLATAAVLFAIVAVGAVIAARVGTGWTSTLSVPVLFAAPMIAIGLIACGFVAPARGTRYTLLSAAAVDFVASGVFFALLLLSNRS